MTNSIKNYKKETIKHINGISNNMTLAEAAEKVLDDVRFSKEFQSGQDELDKLHDVAKSQLNEKLVNIPDMPMAQIQFLAPLIKEEAIYFKGSQDQDSYWRLNYLISLYDKNVDMVADGYYDEEKTYGLTFDSSLPDIIDAIIENMTNTLNLVIGSDEQKAEFLALDYISMILSLKSFCFSK